MARNLYDDSVIAHHQDGCCVARIRDVMARLAIGAIVAVEMLKIKVSEADTTYSGYFHKGERLDSCIGSYIFDGSRHSDMVCSLVGSSCEDYSRCKFLTCHEFSRQCLNHVKMSFSPKVLRERAFQISVSDASKQTLDLIPRYITLAPPNRS